MSADACAVGVDLGGTQARAALVDLAAANPERRIVAEARAAVAEHAPDAVADLVAEVVSRVAAGRATAVGVGFAGMLRGATGVVENAPNYGWRGVDLRALLRARLGERVDLYNDLGAITWGEARYGAGRGARDLMCVFVGTGIGSGLVIDGRLATGSSHVAGEIGHVKIAPPGPGLRACGCGQRGCVEAYASGRHLAERARAAVAAGATTSALALAGSLAELHAGHLDEAARGGDPFAREFLDEAGALLGTAIANAVTLLNPERLILGGGVWQRAPELRRPTLAAYHAQVNAPSGAAATVVDSALGDAAGVIGAAALVAAEAAG